MSLVKVIGVFRTEIKISIPALTFLNITSQTKALGRLSLEHLSGPLGLSL
jgi:hypothetical protein